MKKGVVIGIVVGVIVLAVIGYMWVFTVTPPLITTCKQTYTSIDTLLEASNHCHVDSDCDFIDTPINFGCYHYINKEVNKSLLLGQIERYDKYKKCSKDIDFGCHYYSTRVNRTDFIKIMREHNGSCPVIVENCSIVPEAICKEGKCVVKAPCAKEGEIIHELASEEKDKNCCEGLLRVSPCPRQLIIGEKCYYKPYTNEGGASSGCFASACINCGNGVCNKYEDFCNCPKDCKGITKQDYKDVEEFCAANLNISSCTEKANENQEICKLCR